MIMSEPIDYELLFLKDEAAIRRLVLNVARGLDRCDWALLRSCFHDDATDDHGIFKGDIDTFCDWVKDEIAKYAHTQHSISNILVETNGDAARSESYFLAYHAAPAEEGITNVIAAGRYLDKFERRNGAWKIIHRHAVYDWNWIAPATDAWADPAVAAIIQRGQRGGADPSYLHFSMA
jgi:hypothetical protein